ncbi:FKBP-type peptidyl-prolyl cis-trans isomerase [Pedobacter sp.]|uniref:FKBP-type peptidyl-prolyl cis-trans isomerase n=1 Tax=Pedobacter sp. TaxID=1411316 RepID=UPI00396C4249
MRKIFLYTAILLVSFVVFNSCTKEYESIESVDKAKIEAYIKKNNLSMKDTLGFYYQIINEGTGNFLKNTDSVLYDFDIKSLDGQVYQSNDIYSNSATYVGYVTSPGAFRTVMYKLKRGGHAKIIIPSYLAFGKNGNGNIPSNEVIVTDLKIFKEASQVELDENRIKAFLTANNITNAVRHSSGIYYQVITPGTGSDAIDDYSTLEVKYVGKLLNGTTFDSSDSFSTTLNGVISGWRTILPLFNSGAKVRIFLPSKYGYGSASTGAITPNSVLDFTIDIIKVTN